MYRMSILVDYSNMIGEIERMKNRGRTSSKFFPDFICLFSFLEKASTSLIHLNFGVFLPDFPDRKDHGTFRNSRQRITVQKLT